MAVLNLKTDTDFKILVKPDQETIVFTGATTYNFIGSGATTVNVNNRDVTIYTNPTGVDIIGSGDTVVTLSGNTYIINTTVPDSAAWGNITGTLSDQTDLQQALNLKTNQVDFTGHTGNTAIHYPMSGISITEAQISDLGSYTPVSDFTGHTGNTSIHYPMSGITITKDQVSDFPAIPSGFTFNEINLSGTTFQLKNWFDQTQSAGRLTTEGEILSNGDGTVYIPAGTGLIKDDQTPTPEDLLANWQNTRHVAWNEVPSLALSNNAYNFIYYQGSTGTIQATTNFYSISPYKDFTIGRAFRTGNDVIVRLCGTNLWNFNRRVQTFGEEVFPIVRASGMIMSNPSSRYIAVSAGILWAELVNRFETNAFTSTTGTFNTWHRDGAGGWIKTTGQTLVSNTNFDNNTGTLAVVDNNRYAVHYVYVLHDSTIHLVYGTSGDLTLSQAQGVGLPASIPPVLSAYATFIGKAIVLKDALTITELQSAFTQVFGVTSTNQHNELGGIQGGAVNDYQHLTSAQVLLVDSVPAKLNTTTFNLHTGDSTIHFTQAQISITESQISDLGDYTLTGTTAALESALNTHTGDTTIHYEMSGITITRSQVSDFITIQGSGDTTVTLSGNTYVVYSAGGGGSTDVDVAVITATTYTLLSTDNGKVLEFSNVASTTITLPTDLPTGFNCNLVNTGGQIITLSSASGVTLRTVGNYNKLQNKYGGVYIYLSAANTLTAIGDLS